jgi:immune inhibitor A
MIFSRILGSLIQSRRFKRWCAGVSLSAALTMLGSSVAPGATAVGPTDDLPARDPISLAHRFLGVTSNLEVSPAPPMSVGDHRSFQVLNQVASRYESVEATLVYASPHAYWWLQDGFSVEQAAFERSAEVFETKAFRVLQMLYGSVTLPSIGADSKIHVLNSRIHGVSGYFSSVDALPRAIHPYSNEVAMIVINLDSFKPGQSAYDETLGHELQHILQWTTNPSNEGWFDEGMSEVVASAVRGSATRGGTFARRPDRPLLAWSDDPSAFAGQYDGSFLIAQYVADRFGLDALGAIVRAGRAPSSIERFLIQKGEGERFDELFGDWLVANVGDPQRVERPAAYRYSQVDPDASTVGQISPSGEWSDTVFQYGTDYLEIMPGVTTLAIQAASAVKIVPAEGAETNQVWWSNRADSLDATLTRRVDLRGRSAAQLRFRTWFDTEPEFDHGYVAVSTDEGDTWRALEGLKTKSANPTGNAYGPSFTGSSGEDRVPRWVDEQIDLSGFVGAEILVRFEYITDQGTSRQGWIVDDISIDESVSEQDQLNWQAAGFVRTPLSVPSRMLVQLISGTGATTSVARYWIDSGVTTTVPISPAAGRTIVSVSGVTPMTMEPMEYSVRAVQ